MARSSERVEHQENVQSATTGQPDRALLDEFVQRVVSAVQPLRIVLFGSAARGNMGPNSDLDVLVIMPDGTHRRNTTRLLHRRLYGFGFAKDIIVATESDISEHEDNPSLIYRQALREGKAIYHAGAQSAPSEAHTCASRAAGSGCPSMSRRGRTAN